MHRNPLPAAALALCLALPLSAKALTIDFNDPALQTYGLLGDGQTFQPARLTEQGFNFTTGDYGRFTYLGQLSPFNADPSGAFLQDFTVAAANGSQFDLIQVEVRATANTQANLPVAVAIRGSAITFAADGLWHTLSLNWSNLSSAHFAFDFLADPMDRVFNGTIAFDNFELAAAVPEPQTWALFALGLGALGLSRRKRVR